MSSTTDTTDAQPLVHDQALLIGFPEASFAARLIDLEQPGNGKLEDAVGSIALSALVAHRDRQWVSFSLHKDFYTGLSRRYHPALSFTTIKHALRILTAHGMIEVEKGKNWRDGGKGVQSRLRATDLLVERAGELITKGLKAPILREPLRLVDEAGHLITYTETARTRQMREDLRTFNAFIADHRIEVAHPGVIDMGGGMLSVPTKESAKIDRVLVPTNTTLFRQFNGDWKHHGRMYGGFWQNLSKEIRKTLTIDGTPIMRADFGNSHYRIAYHDVRADPGPEDAYIIEPYGKEGRAVVKVAANIALNDSRGREHAITTVAYDLAKRDRALETGNEDGAQIGPFEMGKARAIIAAVERHHQAITPLFYTGAGLRFMAIEADVVAAVMKAAMRLGIPVLPIHDEIIMPVQHYDTVVELMHHEWAKRISVPALVRP